MRDSALFSIVRAEWQAAKANLETRLQRYLDRAAMAALEPALDPVHVDAHLVQPVQQLHMEPTLALEPAAGPAAEAAR